MDQQIELLEQNQEVIPLEVIEKKIEFHLEKIDEHQFAVGLDLIVIRENFLYKQKGHSTFEDYCQKRWGWTSQRARQLIEASKTFQNIIEDSATPTNVGISVKVAQIPQKESHLRPLVRLEPEEQREVWQRANDTAPNGKITGAHVERTVQEFKQEVKLQNQTKPKQADYITLDVWQTFDERAKRDVIEAAKHETGAKFNQTNDNVEWALWTWNPITGCLHNCPYCYARDIANRFFEQKFTPAFIPSRLTAPANTKQPDLTQVIDPVTRVGLRSVFVCSMADLFGKWVPTEWIEAVLEQVRLNPQWNFLLLTKFPIRMAEFEYPANAWLGTSVDHQWAVERAEKAFRKLRASGYKGVAWLSCEPMMERLTFSSLDMFNWVVIGGASKSTQTPEFKPPREWVMHLWNQADQAGCKVYEKTNLLERRREYPW